MLKYASKYHSKQKRSLLESRFQYRNQFLRAALFISIFKFGVLNSTMFKGYIFKTLITNLMISKNINSLTKKNILNTATLKSCELYGTTTRAKDAIATYAFLRPQSTCLLFGFFVKLLVTGAKSNINNFEQAKVA